MKINCAITVIQPNTKPPSPAPAPTATAVKPTAAPAAVKPIKSTDDLIKEFPGQFTGIGRFPGEYTIQLCYNVHSVIHAPRKCPIALCPKVKEHINKMECMGVITCVDQPMDWVSSNTYIQKANGELCLCLDPHDLSETIHCADHKTPTVEEVAYECMHLHYFTKPDACYGYWSTILDQESSLLTTLNSPFGRYHSLHLPFDLICFQDIFQKKMDQILEECQGCIGITDDITVNNCTEVEHNACLWNLMHVTRKYGLVFNPQNNTCEGPSCQFLWLSL